ncbi:MAG: YggS family pyridoxal phosphate-dependent enzyme [Candidatus Omnitrophica bacterium]|nr:YggS family pyridoxal phosphate-dependent enzyme [Candidatus Omnitrophota bacterium]
MRIFSQIEAVCHETGRVSSEITVVGVTKFVDVPQIQEAIEAGLKHIGESKVQEARKKFPGLGNSDIKVTRHMIGHLQTNKVKAALEVFDCIQSVDSLKLAAAIEEQAAKLNRSIDILIQVNTAGEEQKFGIDPSEVFTIIKQVIAFKHVCLQGLMTVAPLTDDKEVVRKCFRDLRLLSEEIVNKFSGDDRVAMTHLSMGMTQDYEIALEEGANMVRIGRAIFQS